MADDIKKVVAWTIEKVDFVFKVDSHHYKWEER